MSEESKPSEENQSPDIGKSAKFDSRHFPRERRLQEFSDRHNPGSLKINKTLSFDPLNASNDNVNIVELLTGAGCLLMFQDSSGYTITPSNRGGLDARFDIVVVTLVKNGEAEVNNPQGHHKLCAGDIYIHATSDFKTTIGESELVRLAFPSNALKELFRKTGEFVVLQEGDPASTILGTAIVELESALRGGGESGRLLSKIAVDFASDILEENILNNAVSGYDILRERAREYIHDNITVATLNPTEVAAYVGTSRSTLYRAFQGLGGVQEYINFVRLEHAKGLLGRGAPDRGGVVEVAFQCGYASSQQFAKSFKRRFGISPTQAR